MRILRERGKTLLISSHILSELGEMCDTLVFMDNGGVMHHGDTESLQRRGAAGTAPGTAIYDIAVAGPVEPLLAWLDVRPGWKCLEPRREGARAEFAAAEPAAVATELRRLVADLPVVEFRRHERRLEETFVDMLRQGQAHKTRPPEPAAPTPSENIGNGPMTAIADTAAAPGLPAPACAKAWREFPTWLPPMLVKELRQGCGAAGSSAFSVLPQTLLFFAFFFIAGQGGNIAASRLNVVFWGIFGECCCLRSAARPERAQRGNRRPQGRPAGPHPAHRLADRGGQMGFAGCPERAHHGVARALWGDALFPRGSESAQRPRSPASWSLRPARS